MTVVIAAIISMVGATWLLLVYHDQRTLAAIQGSGGLDEVFTLPMTLIVPGACLGALGGVFGYVVRKRARIMLSLLVAGGALLCGTDAFPQARPLFTQHERQRAAGARPNPLCRPEPYETTITYSEVTVFDSREVVYQMSTVVPCLGQVGDPPLALRWESPSPAAVFRYRLSAPEFEQFKIFLNRADVQGIHSFMNAGPGMGDFKIAIARPAGDQNIEVVSLSPNHFQLVDDPSLIHLICKAKEMARISSRSGELPEWCRNARPLNPVSGPK